MHDVMVGAVVVEGVAVVSVVGTAKVVGMAPLAVVIVVVGAIVRDGRDCWRT